MKSKRKLLFRLAAILVLAAIASVMMVIGRGHTVYFDNQTLDYEGTTYEAPYKVVVMVDGEDVAKLYEKERGMTTCIGQTLRVTLEITQEKGGEEEIKDISISLPYNMDGIIINLPAYLAGAPEEAYLSEFIIVEPEPTEEDEAVPGGDDMMLPGEDDMGLTGDDMTLGDI